MRVDPGGGEMFSDPRTVCVDDLTEEQFRPDGDDLAAQRHRTQAGAGTRRPSSRYCTPVTHVSTTAAHRTVWTRVWCPVVEGSSAPPTARSGSRVLIFASRVAGTLMPRRARRERHAVWMSSLAAINVTAGHHHCPTATSAAMAASTQILSASGSRKAPDRV